MRGGGDCPMPNVSDPFSASSWNNAFKGINCYWKEQDVKGLIPKPGGLNVANTINNVLNYTSSTVNDVYEMTDRKNKEIGAKMDNTVAKIRSWSDAPMGGGRKKSKSKSKTKTKSKKVKKTTPRKRRASKMRGGGGSDWVTTVHSRGNVSAPDNYWGVDGQLWNKQFQKSGDYIPNSELARGSYQLQQSPQVKTPSGFDPNGLQQQAFF